MPHFPNRQLTQVVVGVSITNGSKGFSILYSYTTPTKTVANPPSPTCKIDAAPPFHTVYALDYQSTLDGWCFRRRVEPKNGSRPIPYQRAANRLSMTTMCKTIDTHYKFYLLFKNKSKGETCYDDPQEGNVPPPQSTGGPYAPTPTPIPKRLANVPSSKKKTAKS